MTELAEREPEFRPTIARRVGADGIQVIDRTIGGAGKALCVFWSAEHARRDCYKLGGRPEDGWGFVETDADKLETLFDLLGEANGMRWVHVEPAPGCSDLHALIPVGVFLEFLREIEDD